MRGKVVTQHIIRKIKQQHLNKVPQREIAESVGVSLGYVNAIINDRQVGGKTYSNEIHPILGYVLYD